MKKTIYFFEPHGISPSDPISDFINIQDHTTNLIKIIFPEINQFKVKNIQENCKIGIQVKQSSAKKSFKSGGFCLAFTMLLIHLSVINDHISVKDISLFLSRNSPDKINNYMGKYIYYISANPFTKNLTKSEDLSQFSKDIIILDLILKKNEMDKIEDEINRNVYNIIYTNNSDITTTNLHLFEKFPFYNAIYRKYFDYYYTKYTNLNHF